MMPSSTEEKSSYVSTAAPDEATREWLHDAMRSLHWYHAGKKAYLTRTSHDRWDGYAADDGAPTTLHEAWKPYDVLCDESRAPVVRWLVGARTNAAFNQLDRHVLAGSAAEMRDLVAVQVAQAEKRMRSDGFWLRCIAEVEKAPEIVSTRELRPSRAC